MSGAGGVQGNKVVAAHQFGCIFQLFDGIFAENFPAGGIDQRHDIPPAKGSSAQLRL